MKKLLIYFIVALGMLACTGKNEPSSLSDKEGALPGKFSVNDSTQVQFSKGNLQYNANTNIWQFAEHQYDYIGEENSENLAIFDLFKWGTGDNPKLAQVYGEYDTFIEWGKNKISNGGNSINTWRTLSIDEWQYLLHGRENAEKLFGLGAVNEIKGLIILPDGWKTPDGSSFVPSTNMGLAWKDDYYNNPNENNFDHNLYTTPMWQKMEEKGAVFLPAAGWEGEKGVYYEGIEGFYWSSTLHYGTGLAYNIQFDKHNFMLQNGSSCSSGCSVRLVH